MNKGGIGVTWISSLELNVFLPSQILCFASLVNDGDISNILDDVASVYESPVQQNTLFGIVLR